MNSTLWTLCVVVLLLLAVVDFWTLWRQRRGEQRDGWFSGFTLAAQGCFAVFAALYLAPRAFQEFSTEDAVMYGELLFLLLMVVGFLADRRGSHAVARKPPD